MTEEERLKALNQILANIKEAISKYNELSPSNPLTLSDNELKIDVSNLYICLVDNNTVGLFEKKYWDYNSFGKHIFEDERFTRRGYVYSGVNSDYVAIKRTFPDKYDYEKGKRTQYAYYDDLVANCIVNKEVLFDDIRKYMFEQGIIPTYTPGRASVSQINAVLEHAYNNYFNIPKDEKLKR